MKLTNYHIRQLIAEERKRVVNEAPYFGRREEIPKTPPGEQSSAQPEVADGWRKLGPKQFVQNVKIGNKNIHASIVWDPLEREFGLALKDSKTRATIVSVLVGSELETAKILVRELVKRDTPPNHLGAYKELWDRIYRPVNEEETMTKQQLKQIIKEELSSLQQEALKLSFPEGQVGQANSATRKNYCDKKFSGRVEECVAFKAKDKKRAKKELHDYMNAPLGQGAPWAGGGVRDFPPQTPRSHPHLLNRTTT